MAWAWGGLASTRITLKTWNIHTMAKIWQIFLQYHHIFERIKELRHECEAGGLGLDIDQEYSG
jgi:hypothetical protein